MKLIKYRVVEYPEIGKYGRFYVEYRPFCFPFWIEKGGFGYGSDCIFDTLEEAREYIKNGCKNPSNVKYHNV